ncbi:DUF6198 family protein [Schinkia azotoformans]|uniref:Integral membrane protein n=1 Tax=Schinkia azotoformans LMG 9581 TaxID=1131731 RepID=K6D6M7_SCHAZ|nr:DUF6198 family protein [Schinkia azotoformans]EKN68167.1 hypothetical protein BAZO_05390 [Schinkia azotoformans LMG 9581]MEC1639670.1 DUF6198 family protein [Schinkia azotoformans]MEC1946970.1 DUF6198 family protein [Schinkia azotoformans]
MANAELIKRYVIFLVGLLFMGLGIALITKSTLGTSPISSVPYVVSLITPFTFGQLTFALSLVCILIEIAILRKDFTKDQYLQVFVGPFFGLFVDLGMFIFSFIIPNYYIEKLLCVVLGSIILALGVYLQVFAGVIINPGEGVVKAIAGKLGKDFGTIKILFDWLLVIIALIISLGSLGVIEGVREGTLISAFLVGFFVKIFNKIFVKHVQIERWFAN